MFDGLYALLGQLHAPIFDDKYSADQAITKATLLEVPKSRKLTVVFLPWHCPEWYEKQLLLRLSATKTNVLVYRFSTSIIQTDVARVKTSFEYVALSVASDVQALQKEKGYTHTTLLGFSLGCVALLIAAEEIKHFDDVILLAPGDTLAGALWNGWRTRRLRNHYKHLGYALADLEREWDIVAPAAHIMAVKGHSIHVILAAKDRFIPHRYGRNLVRALKDAHAKVTFAEKPFGHMATILSYHPGD